MSIALLFWILCILAVVGLFWLNHPAGPPAFRPYGWLFLFILIVLLGWKVFGPALHG